MEMKQVIEGKLLTNKKILASYGEKGKYRFELSFPGTNNLARLPPSDCGD